MRECCHLAITSTNPEPRSQILRSVCPTPGDPQGGSNMGSPGREPGVCRAGRGWFRPARRVERDRVRRRGMSCPEAPKPLNPGIPSFPSKSGSTFDPPRGSRSPTGRSTDSPGFTRGYPRWTGLAGPLRTSDIVDRPAPVAGELRTAFPAACDAVAPVPAGRAPRNSAGGGGIPIDPRRNEIRSRGRIVQPCRGGGPRPTAPYYGNEPRL